MSETLLTKCPHCSTTFRLTQAQLQIAGGAVRCGACYQVFHANEHIVKTAVVEEIRQAPPPQPDPVEEAFELNTEDGLDPYDAAEFDMDSPDADLFSADYQRSMEPQSTLDEFGYAETDTGKKKKGSDESWAEELLKELGEDDEQDDELIHDDTDSKKKKSTITSSDNAFALDDGDVDRPPAKKRNSGNDLSDTFRTLGAFSGDDPFAITEIEEETGQTDANDESWAKAMLDELEQSEAPKNQPEGLAIQKEEKPKDADNPFAAKELARSRREAVERARAQEKLKPKAPKKPAATGGKGLRNDETEEFFRLLDEPAGSAVATKNPTEPSLQLEDLDDLKDLENDLRDTSIKPDKLFKDANDIINQQIKISSLRYADEEPKSNTGRNVLLVLGTLALVLAGLAQYAYFNFDNLARNPQWRPVLEQACASLGCQLPSQVDLDAIIGTNLVVRSHPHERNALVIDVIIKNRAPFEQPFPAVQLNFEDMNGNPVAGRRFQPREYIHDPTVNIRRMPPDTPIHLTLEIVDPGRSAESYQIQFLPADVGT